MSAPALGERIGRYTLVAPLGTGGMATVYLARAPGPLGTTRDVALKIVHPHVAADPALVATFIEEARIAARIRHPSVVLVLDVAEAERGPYLVMEYIAGGSLADLVGQGPPLPLELGMQILADALLGLHAAHELLGEHGEPLGLVHRDFTPHNILVGVDGMARLTDFGIAKVADKVAVTAQGLVKGKLGYMAPEQARGLPLDRRADLWAAGVIGWELLAGERLYGGEAEAMTLLRLLSERPPDVRTKNPAVPGPLADLVASALSADPADRPATAEVFRARVLGVIGAPVGRERTERLAAWVRQAMSTPAPLPARVEPTETVLLAAAAEPSLPEPPVARPAAAGRWAAIAALSSALLVGGLWWWSSAASVASAPPEASSAGEHAAPPGRPEDLPAVVAAPPAVVAESPAALEEEASAEPSGAPAPRARRAARRPSAQTLSYSADRPVAKVRIQGKSGVRVAAGHGARGVVSLLPEEQGIATLVFIAADGTEQSVKPSLGSSRVEVRFEKRPKLEANPYVAP